MVEIGQRSCFQAVPDNVLSLSLNIYMYNGIYLACLGILDRVIKRKRFILLVKKLLVAFCTKISCLIISIILRLVADFQVYSY